MRGRREEAIRQLCGREGVTSGDIEGDRVMWDEKIMCEEGIERVKMMNKEEGMMERERAKRGSGDGMERG